MKATIKLVEVQEISLGIQVAILNVKLKSEINEDVIKFNVSSTGMSLRLTSEISINELYSISKWLEDESSDKSNLRDNDAELRLLAKKLIKISNELETEITL